MNAVDLSAVSDERLIEELANRARARAEKKPHDIAWCEDCVHFRVWTRSSEPPRNYNPCSEGHKMQFQMPADHNPYADMGLFRIACEDRKLTRDADGGMVPV